MKSFKRRLNMMLVRPCREKRNWRGIRAIVIQSDDWGYCGGTPNRYVFDKLYPILERRYDRKHIVSSKTTLESPGNMESVFEILEKYKDTEGRHPVFQAAYVVCNPDYQQIRNNQFQNYVDIPLPQVPLVWERGNIISKALDGIRRGVWRPIYHGISHFNTTRWMKRLSEDNDVKEVAMHGCFLWSEGKADYEFGDIDNLKEFPRRLARGMNIFKRIFGYLPDTAVMPGYVWPLKIEPYLASSAITILEGKNLQVREQTLLEKIRGKAFNLMGYKDAAKLWQISPGDFRPDIGIYYLTRNVYFEPYSELKLDINTFVEKTISTIEKMWNSNQPAIITTHRANYVSWDESVAEKGLQCLDLLLKKLLYRYPNLSFYTDLDLIPTVDFREDKKVQPQRKLDHESKVLNRML